MTLAAPSRAARRAERALPTWVPRPGGTRGSLLYGTAAAAACAALYYGLRAASGYELTVIAVGVGHAVGRGVGFGAGAAPLGRQSRVLAVALTFLAIAAGQLGGAMESELELFAHATRGAVRSSRARLASAVAPSNGLAAPGVDPCDSLPAETDVGELLWAELEGSAAGSSPAQGGRASALARLCALRRARAQSAAPLPASPTGVASSVAALRSRAAAAIVGDESGDEDAGGWLRATLARPLEEALFGTPLAALVAAALLGASLRRAWRAVGP